MLFEKIGGRKFVAYIVTVIGGILVHVLSAKGMSTELTALMLGALGTFSASNAFVTRATATQPEGEGVESEAPAASEPDPRVEVLMSQVGELQAVSAQVLNSVNGIGSVLTQALTPRQK